MQHEAPEITAGIKESVSKLLNVPATDIEDGKPRASRCGRFKSDLPNPPGRIPAFLTRDC